MDNSKCVALTNLAKATVISLNPEGDIPLGAGDKTTVTIKGATAPRVWPLFAQAEKLKSVVTADIQDGSTLEISAAPDTAAGSYPFIVTDGTAEMPFKVFVKSADAEPTAMTDADCKKQQKQQARTRHRHAAASATGQ